MSTIDVLKTLFLASGASWVLWALFGLSAVGVALTVERLIFFHELTGDLHSLANALDARLSKGEFRDAIADLDQSPAVAARVASAGLKLADRGPAAAEKAMESAAALERTRMERGLIYLATLGNNAPFLGLFGTVVGVIAAFEALGTGAGGPATTASAAAGAVASQAVMSSIAEALVSTAVGILVALPAVAANNYLQRRSTAILAATDVLKNLVLAYLSDSKLPASEAA